MPIKTDNIEEMAINKMFLDISKAWSAGDAKAVAAHWLEDGSLVNPFGQIAWTRDGVEKQITKNLHIMKGGIQTFEDFHIILVSDDLALIDNSLYVAGLKNPDGANVPTRKFHNYAVVIKRGGQWMVKSIHAYAFLPLPEAK